MNGGARPNIAKKHIVILTDSGAIPSFYVRLLDPLVTLTSNYNVVHSWQDGAERLAAEADLIVVQRWFNTPVRRAVEAARARGVPVIYETDDNLLDLSPDSALQFSQDQKNNMIAMMRDADVTTVSTQSMADWARQYTDRIVVLRNYGLDKPSAPKSTEPHLAIVNTDYFKLSDSKATFFDALCNAVTQLNYRITFFGSVDPGMRAMQLAHPERIGIVEGFLDDRSAFLDRVLEAGINVAAVPLEDTPQHRFKSDIKFLDFASIGVPCLFNNRHVYSELRHHEDSVLCDDSFDGWADGLRYLASTEERARLGAAAREVARSSRSLGGYAEQMKTLYASVLEIDGRSRTSIRYAPPSKQISIPRRPALMWGKHGLELLANGTVHHVAHASLIPRLLDGGVGLLDRQTVVDPSAGRGLPITSFVEVDAFLKQISWTVPSALRADLGRPLKINWILPGLLIGGGGHRNIIRCAYQLEQLGHEVGLFFIDTPQTAAELAVDVRDHFYPLRGRVGLMQDLTGDADILFATHWTTVRYAERFKQDVGEIIYFVQDFEPHFYAMGSEYVMAENTYRRGYYAITSGVWCEQFLRNNFDAEADHFRFPLASDIYKIYPQSKRRDCVLFFAKPEMPRRCYELGVEALRRLRELKPDVEICFYGSRDAVHHQVDFSVTQLGLLPDTLALARAYNEASLGVVFSTTNPSLVPYEMMACGLPVVDLGRPGNAVNYGGRHDIAFLADPEPRLMGEQIAALLDDPADRRARSDRGVALALSFPREEDVGRQIEQLLYRRVAAWPMDKKQRLAT